ncbi:MAG: iron-containing alcohol dehydrogenase [Proteobacteria bacterium]|nr:iron-containing alcohol dehydrogenase [Desulfobulbaceae bacterium]MBU4152873.1 iron-containing alcohol dehydrogenase [Pseudomonadota bacterium]
MILSPDFTVRQPTTIRFGCGAIADLGMIVKNLKGTKVFLVADPGVVAANLMGKITKPLDDEAIPFTIFTEIDPEPGLRLADRGAELARQAGADCVVGVGGGSAMDVAKAVSILLTNGGCAENYLGLGKIAKAGVPKIMVPTTAGTGAEVSFTAVFINEKTSSKGGMNGDPLYPEAAILDPELTLTMPPHVTAATGIDAFTHAIEAFVSTQSHPISDMYALEAMKLISASLPKVYAHGGNISARTDMLLGSMLAGKALATAGVGLVHAMAYPLGGMFGIPHGLANAVLLPYVLQYNLLGAPEKYARVAALLGCEVKGIGHKEAARCVVEAVFELNMEIGIPATLADLNIPGDKIPEMAKIALTVTRPVENNPRRPTYDDVVNIYQVALNGWD